MAAQGPVHKLLYSPPLGSNIGDLYGIFEGKPDLFYILSTYTAGTTGASIFTVSSEGAFSLVYAFPPSTETEEFVRATNGKVLGGAFTNTPPNDTHFYYSIDPSGKNLQEYLFPGTWGPSFNTVVAPPNYMYDLAANAAGSQVAYSFVRLPETGKITILHQFSSSDGCSGWIRRRLSLGTRR